MDEDCAVADNSKSTEIQDEDTKNTEDKRHKKKTQCVTDQSKSTKDRSRRTADWLLGKKAKQTQSMPEHTYDEAEFVSQPPQALNSQPDQSPYAYAKPDDLKKVERSVVKKAKSLYDQELYDGERVLPDMKLLKQPLPGMNKPTVSTSHLPYAYVKPDDLKKTTGQEIEKPKALYDQGLYDGKPVLQMSTSQEHTTQSREVYSYATPDVSQLKNKSILRESINNDKCKGHDSKPKHEDTISNNNNTSAYSYAQQDPAWQLDDPSDKPTVLYDQTLYDGEKVLPIINRNESKQIEYSYAKHDVKTDLETSQLYCYAERESFEKEKVAPGKESETNKGHVYDEAFFSRNKGKEDALYEEVPNRKIKQDIDSSPQTPPKLPPRPPNMRSSKNMDPKVLDQDPKTVCEAYSTEKNQQQRMETQCMRESLANYVPGGAGQEPRTTSAYIDEQFSFCNDIDDVFVEPENKTDSKRQTLHRDSKISTIQESRACFTPEDLNSCTAQEDRTTGTMQADTPEAEIPTNASTTALPDTGIDLPALPFTEIETDSAFEEIRELLISDRGFKHASIRRIDRDGQSVERLRAYFETV